MSDSDKLCFLQCEFIYMYIYAYMTGALFIEGARGITITKCDFSMNTADLNGGMNY